MDTILITGACSDIGKAAALRFQSEDWNVIASMRDPAAGVDLAAPDNVHVTRLDVTGAGSIAAEGPSTSRWTTVCPIMPRRPGPWAACSANWPPTFRRR
ncbi:hypothetical protein GC209_18740 [bacterium]|nr:hypothetical protein [bacterium]